MKYILAITLILNSLLLASSQVILGSYSSTQRAINVKAQIDEIIQNDFRFKNFLIKKNITTKVEESENYFIVAIGPIDDIVSKRAVLNRVKKTSFKDAYLVNIKEVIDEGDEVLDTNITQESFLEDNKSIAEDLVVNTSKIIIPTTIDRVTSRIKNSNTNNMLDKYFNETAATIVILLLSIIYLIIKKRQHTNIELESLNLKAKNEINQIDDPYEHAEDATKNELVFENIDKIESPTEKLIATSVTSNVVKKQVPAHDKITKKDFQDFQGSRIMLAEDNIINQKVIRGLLSDSQIDIVIVDDGQEALDFLEKDSNISIILMDVHMPNINGYEATKRIRANSKYSHITIVALTGDTSSDDVEKMKKAGMQEQLEKPLKMDSLYDVLYSYTRQQENYEELEKALYIEDGLEICGGDPEFYKDILSYFIKDNADSTDQIKKLLNSKEFEKAQEFLLDLMGVAGNIGANRIKALAAELRTSINTHQDNKYLDLFKIYSKNYKKLEQEIKDYL